MKQKLITLLLTVVSCVGITCASDTSVDGIWYNFNGSTLTAEVTFRGSSYTSYSNEYDGSVSIPSSVTYFGEKYIVTSIGEYTFYSCTGLTSIEIPNSVTSIGEYAFENCTGLTSIEIPNSVTSIGNSAFAYCIGLTSVHISDIAAWCAISFENIASNPLNNAQNLYLNDELITELDIPDDVSSIRNSAFWGCSCLTSVTIPNSVTSIGEYAFENCTGLTSIEIPNSVTSIGVWAFNNCSGLTSVTISNSVTCLGEHVFCLCSSLTSVTIPNSVTSIGVAAFGGCSSLTSVTIPNSVTSIGNNAFGGCRSLTSVTIPNSVTSIGDEAFLDCTGLTSVHISNLSAWCSIAFASGEYIESSNPLSYAHNLYMNGELITDLVIPNDITEIKHYAFYGCRSLTSVTIPNSVTSIGYMSFYGCANLETVNVRATLAPSLWSYEFQNCSSLTSINYPCGSSESYESTWSAYSSYLNEDCEEASITANADPVNPSDYYSTYFNGTRKMALPDNGTEAYIAEINDDELTLTMIADGDDVIPANTAVILKASTANFTLVESTADAVTFSAENDLRGVDVVTPLEDLGLTRSTCYVLSGNSTDGVGFFQCNSDNLKAHKAYLPYAGGPAGAPKHIRFVFDETEDVGQVQGENVQGTKVLRNGQLIIIRNGVEYNIAGQIVK